MLRSTLTAFILFVTLFSKAQGITWVQYIVNQKQENVLPAYIVSIQNNGQVFYQGIKQAPFNGFIMGKLMPGEWQKLEAFLKPLSNTTYTAEREIIEEYGQRHLLWQTPQGLKRRMNMAPTYPKEEKLVAYLENLISKKVNWDRNSFIPHPNEMPPANIPLEPGFSYLDPPSMAGDLVEEPTIPEIQVRFPGGDDSLKQYIRQHLVIPQLVLENNLTIRAFYEIKFAVDGRVMDVKIIRSSGNQEADMEGLKLIRRMPNWLPAQYRGQRVPATYNLPITFKPE